MPQMATHPDPLRFSLKHLLLAVAAVSGVLGVGLSWGWGPGAAVALGMSGWMLYVGIRQGRHRLVSAGMPLVFISGAAVAVYLFAWTVLGVGPIFHPQYYPSGLADMRKAADASWWDVKAYGLGGFIDSEYVWRLKLSPSHVDRVTNECDLHPAPLDRVPPTFFSAFPGSWRPRPRAEAQFYASPGFDGVGRGPDGLHYLAMYDPQKMQLYVWCKDNF